MNTIFGIMIAHYIDYCSLHGVKMRLINIYRQPFLINEKYSRIFEIKKGGGGSDWLMFKETILVVTYSNGLTSPLIKLNNTLL